MLTEIIRQRVYAYPQWSPAERRVLEAITEEVLHYCRAGEGNAFIARWCLSELQDIFSPKEIGVNLS